MTKKYCWHYQLSNRIIAAQEALSLTSKPFPSVDSHIVLPTCCGMTAATEIAKRYDEDKYITFLNLLGECDE